MFFSKKSGFHCLILYVQGETPHPLHVVIPSDVAGDVISTIKKFEKSSLNEQQYIGSVGPFVIIQDIQGFQKIEIHNDTHTWSDPILYTDFAKKIAEKLQDLVDDDNDEVEEDLIYFVGEFTMMMDNGFVAPF
jgi:ABC-type Zn uptake system ZnuABC Zn-binding protein ZnuA